ncbi:putative ARP2/3 complex subunit [Leishmania infantum JPCM5]|uniref:ARP2/3_complex_subunit_-_putative n=2 Tax=Leishmania infantum TaxID=5671 RepID=A0A6L0WL62_LEIIN|nr:putative ARP2/3 complex subunit [Leishmania infantum JPCM5]CAC9438038.1 ARP2/3_complex_subunit_-_putative [Leishmania infantum]CAM65288.1 putative ARP2/3 complex subunit [Leishmania infantum JPCM5]SUZ38682.1 ARP2/3_complex_subunit_-_putative [Leishmania infantum]|eukprot:XP_001462747.1 putative ARP2/3 complex subunit [Leishmania infantum JPCM5]
MALAKQPYYDCVERTLLAALCLQSFASDVTEGCAVPEVEQVPLDAGTGAPPSSFLVHRATADAALRCHALRLQWSSGDECLIEGSCDSTRVSFWFAAAHQPDDALSAQLLSEYIAFFCSHGAATGALPILRCIPVRRTSAGKPAADKAGQTTYDVSFLVLAEHVYKYGRQPLARSILTFVQEVEAAVANVKVSLNARRRAAAQAFFALPE